MSWLSELINRFKRKKDTSPPVIVVPATGLLELHNNYRSQFKLKPLIVSEALNTSAYQHCFHMFNTKSLFHSVWSGSSTAVWWYKGENIASGQKTDQEVFNTWINSRGHRANIINMDYTHIGLARVGDYWCVQFGRKA
jgi:uncharacterized protein YkwD